MSQVVLASGNAGKLREFGAMLAPFGWTVVPQGQLGIAEAEEPHVTFVENALAKARHASRHSGMMALADDSGLCVDALTGAPGVRSARYAGGSSDDQANNQKLIQELRKASPNPSAWTAEFVCVLVLVRHAHDPLPLIAQGRWRGRIVEQPLGKGGFGYDPHFYLTGLGQTASQLPSDLKNRISHRAQALTRLRQQIEAQASEAP
jgi:XTP/dITP diphosphohydrolase